MYLKKLIEFWRFNPLPLLWHEPPQRLLPRFKRWNHQSHPSGSRLANLNTAETNRPRFREDFKHDIG